MSEQGLIYVNPVYDQLNEIIQNCMDENTLKSTMIACVIRGIKNEVLDIQPTIDPETLPIVQELREELEKRLAVVHAHWIDDSGERDTAVCSNCGECYDKTEEEWEWRKAFELFKQFYHYCPNCGAKMDEER